MNSYRNAAALAAAVEALPPLERRRFIRRLKDLGIIERQPRGERYAARNDAIEAARQRGLTIGQIAIRQEGMTPDAVKKVLRRRRQKVGTRNERPQRQTA